MIQRLQEVMLYVQDQEKPNNFGHRILISKSHLMIQFKVCVSLR